MEASLVQIVALSVLAYFMFIFLPQKFSGVFNL